MIRKMQTGAEDDADDANSDADDAEDDDGD